MRYIQNKLLVLLLCLCPTFLYAEYIQSIEIHNKEKIKLNVEVFKIDLQNAPTVIVLHGCGGVDSHHRDWAKQLNVWGFNAVVLDSFSTRYERTVCQKPFSVTPSQRAVDLQFTAKWVSEQSWGKAKIGVIGFSHGAWTTLYAASKNEITREVGTTLISSAVAFYPYCDNSRFFDLPAMPIQIHSGNQDTWAPSTLCNDLSRTWNISNSVFIYADSYHGFDRANTNIFVAGHTLRSNSDANALARARTRDFLNKTLVN
jgi:dienelactone hydrolase